MGVQLNTTEVGLGIVRKAVVLEYNKSPCQNSAFNFKQTFCGEGAVWIRD